MRHKDDDSNKQRDTGYDTNKTEGFETKENIDLDKNRQLVYQQGS